MKCVLGLVKTQEILTVDPVDLSENKRLSREAKSKTKRKPDPKNDD